MNACAYDFTNRCRQQVVIPCAFVLQHAPLPPRPSSPYSLGAAAANTASRSGASTQQADDPVVQWTTVTSKCNSVQLQAMSCAARKWSTLAMRRWQLAPTSRAAQGSSAEQPSHTMLSILTQCISQCAQSHADLQVAEDLGHSQHVTFISCATSPAH